MTDDKSERGILKINSLANQTRCLSLHREVPMRSGEELDPVARQISLDRHLMQRFREVMGCGDEERARAMVDEVRLIAQTIDPSVSYAEGARVTVYLMQIAQDQDTDG